MKNDVISPEFDENGRPLRRIRSFVRRQGRLTKGQQLALDNYWPEMGVEYQPQPLDMVALFGREAPLVLERLNDMDPFTEAYSAAQFSFKAQDYWLRSTGAGTARCMTG